MRWALVVLAGCWSAPAAKPNAPEATNAPSGTCTIRDRGIALIAPLVLELAGESFTALHHTVQRIEIAAARRMGRVVVETDGLVLEGDVDLAKLPVRTRDEEPRDGWLEIKSTYIRATHGSKATLAVELPRGIEPSTHAVEVPCDEITLAYELEHEPASREIVDVVKTTPLRATIDGTRIGRIVVDPARARPPVHVEVLERIDGMLQVRLTEPNAVVGWIPEASTDDPSFGADDVATVESLSGGYAPFVNCGWPVPVYVRSRRRGVVRVGTLKKNVSVLRGTTGSDEIELEVGGGTLTPFVLAADTVGCAF